MKALNNITSSEASQSLNAISEVELEFVVNLADGSTDVAADIYLSDIETTMGIVIDDMNATAHITNLNIGKMTTISS